MRSKLLNDKINGSELVLVSVPCHGVSVIAASCWASAIRGTSEDYRELGRAVCTWDMSQIYWVPDPIYLYSVNLSQICL